MWLGVFFITAIALFDLNECINESTIVHTNYGDIRGYQTDFARIFYGIPFAQPPVDKLR
jgi:hypothetical protein